MDGSEMSDITINTLYGARLNCMLARHNLSVIMFLTNCHRPENNSTELQCVMFENSWHRR